jgi:CheY-like chemotaxis protein
MIKKSETKERKGLQKETAMAPTILIVDDEEDLREAIAFDFRKRKFTVLTAKSGNEALGLIERHPIQVVLSDVRMPDGDGLSLLSRIKDRDVNNPPVIFVTGYTDISVEEAYRLGAEAVFAKPFDRDALFAAVKEIVEPVSQRYNRATTRVQADLEMGLQFAKGPGKLPARILNLGRGGFFASLERPEDRSGQTLRFRLLTDTRPRVSISGEGVVRWARTEANGDYPLGYGIEFTAIDKECLWQLTELINFLKTKSFIPRR